MGLHYGFTAPTQCIKYLLGSHDQARRGAPGGPYPALTQSACGACPSACEAGAALRRGEPDCDWSARCLRVL